MSFSGETFTFIVGKEDQGKRLDIFLTEHITAASRSQIQRYIREGYILLNDLQVKVGTKLKEGDLIIGRTPAPKVSEVLPEDLPIKFLYEDEYIAVVDKPPGMVVHPAARVTSGTLVNALLFRCRDLQGVGGVLRPGIVHRLDKGTSGVMVVAKNDLAHETLTRQFKNREIKKLYLALVFGRMEEEEGIITSPVGRHPRDRKRFSVRTRTPREALTYWWVKERFEQVTFLQIRPKTGRTHQIRVHLSFIGHPLLGDPLYTKKKRLALIKDPTLRERIRTLGRQALHAHLLAFRHPATDRFMEFTSPLPEDIAGILEVLRGERV
ncbi:MAG: RluA family pseudouridine synthase [Deltaproteobacteria bacterium]|nr:MAG: RluA family pseudouridine synthase [Deltaproteobacteria bacterium]